jgi:hypothetical protein
MTKNDKARNPKCTIDIVIRASSLLNMYKHILIPLENSSADENPPRPVNHSRAHDRGKAALCMWPMAGSREISISSNSLSEEMKETALLEKRQGELSGEGFTCVPCSPR